MIKASIQLPGFNAYFDEKVKEDIQIRIATSIPSIKTSLRQRIHKLVTDSIKLSPEYLSLLGGNLKGELGLPDISYVDRIIEQWATNVEVLYRPATPAAPLGAIKIGIIQSDYTDVLSLSEAKYIYTTGRSSGLLQWLRWLLLEGTSPIVMEYAYAPINSSHSRTGMGIMKRSPGATWSVPAEFAGTVDDNFATRSVLGAIQVGFESMMRTELNRRIK
jgi:hypothetical protein